jgi:hypothetical protein
MEDKISRLEIRKNTIEDQFYLIGLFLLIAYLITSLIVKGNDFWFSLKTKENPQEPILIARILFTILMSYLINLFILFSFYCVYFKNPTDFKKFDWNIVKVFERPFYTMLFFYQIAIVILKYAIIPYFLGFIFLYASTEYPTNHLPLSFILIRFGIGVFVTFILDLIITGYSHNKTLNIP